MTSAAVPAASYRWLVLATMILGLFPGVLDAAVVNVALPVYVAKFGANLNTAEWIALVFRLVTAIILLPAGRAADLLGRRKVYLAGLALFTVASALCAIAPNVGLLIAARVLQALGTTGMLATYSAIIVAVFPESQRGQALGIGTTVMAVATAISPTTGALLVDLWGPASVFVINLPIGLIGLVAALAVLKERTVSITPEPGARFDWAGAILSSAAILTLLLALEERVGPYAIAPIRPILLVVGVALLGLFVAVERRLRHPMLDIGLFRVPSFTISASLIGIGSLSLGLVTYLIPLFIQLGLGRSIVQAGFDMLPLAVVLMVAGPLFGTLSDHWGARGLTAAGMALMTGSLALLAGLSLSAPLMAVVVPLTIFGLGTGLYQAPNNSVAFGSAPKEKHGVVGGVRSMLISLGIAVGVALGNTIVDGGLQAFGGSAVLTSAPLSEASLNAYLAAQAQALWVTAAFTACGAVLAFLQPRRV
ncbi:MAG: MFS transporter [Dehalococcoidia bacterium]